MLAAGFGVDICYQIKVVLLYSSFSQSFYNVCVRFYHIHSCIYNSFSLLLMWQNHTNFFECLTLCSWDKPTSSWRGDVYTLDLVESVLMAFSADVLSYSDDWASLGSCWLQALLSLYDVNHIAYGPEDLFIDFSVTICQILSSDFTPKETDD